MSDEERKKRLADIARAQAARAQTRPVPKDRGTTLATVIESMNEIEEFILPKVIRASEAQAFMKLQAQKSIRLRKRLEDVRDLIVDIASEEKEHPTLEMYNTAEMLRTLDLVRDHLRQDEVPCHIVEDSKMPRLDEEDTLQ